MTEQTENATRLARPLIRLAKLVGVATSYVGMSHDYHEIEDDVLVAVLKALGIDASNDEAINQSITSIKSERETRVVAPTVLHIVGKESKVAVHGGMFDVPEASITLENGKQFTGKISHEGGEKIAHEIDGSFFFTSYLVLPADLPEGYHTLEVTVGSEAETATVISAPEKIELLDDMKNGSLWGWMSQLYSIRSKGSWGVGDFEDLKTMLVEAKKKAGSDFMLINPMHAAEPVPPLTPSPYLPISRRFINFSYIRPESMPEYLTLSHEDRAEVDALHEQVESLNDDARLIDRDAMWRVKKHALWVIYKAGRTKARQAEFDRYLAECGDEIESYATWCLCYDKVGAPPTTPIIGCANTTVIPKKSRSCVRSSRTPLSSTAGLSGSPPISCTAAQQAASQGRYEDWHRRGYGRRSASGRIRCVVESGTLRQGRHGRCPPTWFNQQARIEPAAAYRSP